MIVLIVLEFIFITWGPSYEVREQLIGQVIGFNRLPKLISSPTTTFHKKAIFRKILEIILKKYYL
jgi:hypothetical protein